jgi:hypothetical protein
VQEAVLGQVVENGIAVERIAHFAPLGIDVSGFPGEGHQSFQQIAGSSSGS